MTAWGYSLSTYRCGDFVQTTGASSAAYVALSRLYSEPLIRRAAYRARAAYGEPLIGREPLMASRLYSEPPYMLEPLCTEPLIYVLSPLIYDWAAYVPGRLCTLGRIGFVL